MKTNSAKKIIVSTLALAMGAGLAGSISGSVAWYQYSTRASASIAGTSAGTTRELQICDTADGTYAQHVDIAERTFKPTSASIGNNGALTFYQHPIYKNATLTELTNTAGYVQEYTFYFKCVDNVNGTPGNVAKPVYLTSINIVDVSSGQNDDKDISKAVRVAINGEVLSLDGGTTTTHGPLNLNGNKDGQGHDIMDKNGYDTNDAEGTEIDYINGTSQSYSSTKVANSTTVVNTNDPYHFATTDSTELSTKVLTNTKNTDTASDPVTIKVWLEGWEELDDSSLWGAAWLNQNFAVQLQFACEADN